MRKIFFLTALLMMLLTTTAFAAEDEGEAADEPYVYTSAAYKYSISCPIKPLAVVQNPWQETDKHGEMLVFANEGFDIQYAYIIQIDAFDTNKVPDFNKGTVAAIGDYLVALKRDGGYATADLVNITKNNKGVAVVTADKIEVVNKETGEVEGEFVADKQYIYTFFRTPEGRCISIQLLSANLTDKQFIDTYRFSVASFKDNIKEKPKKDKKSKKDKEKKAKEKKDKEKKAKEKKPKEKPAE